MEIYKTKFRGSEISVIFTGSHYYFHNSFFGVIAIAERDYERTSCSDNPARTFFYLSIGNAHCQGSSFNNGAVECFVRKFIKKNEQRYKETNVEFLMLEYDLNRGCLTCEFKPYER